MSVGGYDLADPTQTTTPALPIPGYLWPGPFYLNRSTRATSSRETATHAGAGQTASRDPAVPRSDAGPDAVDAIERLSMPAGRSHLWLE
jgi:hypothetical protein